MSISAKKETDRPARLRGNALDAALVLLLIFSLFGTAFRTGMIRSFLTGERVRENVTLRVRSVPAESAACVLPGETVRTVTGEVIGTVVSVWREESEVTLFSGGIAYTGAYDTDEICDLCLLVAADATRGGDGGIRIAGIPLLGGAVLPVRTERFSAQAEVLLSEREPVP